MMFLLVSFKSYLTVSYAYILNIWLFLSPLSLALVFYYFPYSNSTSFDAFSVFVPYWVNSVCLHVHGWRYLLEYGQLIGSYTPEEYNACSPGPIRCPWLLPMQCLDR